MKITDVKNLGCRQSAARHRRQVFHLRQAHHRRRRRRLWRGLQRHLLGPCHRENDRGHGRALPRRPRSARHRELLPPRLFVRLHPAPRRVRHGLFFGARNRLLGHHRQGGRQAGLQAARRAGARNAAFLHLPLSAQRQRPFGRRPRQERLQRPRPGGRMRARICRAGLSTPSSSIRPAPTRPSTATSRVSSTSISPPA